MYQVLRNVRGRGFQVTKCIPSHARECSHGQHQRSTTTRIHQNCAEKPNSQDLKPLKTRIGELLPHYWWLGPVSRGAAPPIPNNPNRNSPAPASGASCRGHGGGLQPARGRRRNLRQHPWYRKKKRAIGEVRPHQPTTCRGERKTGC